MPNTGDFGVTRMFFKINENFNSIPKTAKIKNATLQVYQYTNLSHGKTDFQCLRLKDNWNINNITWSNSVNINCTPSGEKSISSSKYGFHLFDIRESVNNWINGLEQNYGLMIKSTDESDKTKGGAFFTPQSSNKNAGQQEFTKDKAPKIVIEWENRISKIRVVQNGQLFFYDETEVYKC